MSMPISPPSVPLSSHPLPAVPLFTLSAAPSTPRGSGSAFPVSSTSSSPSSASFSAARAAHNRLRVGPPFRSGTSSANEPTPAYAVPSIQIPARRQPSGEDDSLQFSRITLDCAMHIEGLNPGTPPSRENSTESLLSLSGAPSLTGSFVLSGNSSLSTTPPLASAPQSPSPSLESHKGEYSIVRRSSHSHEARHSTSPYPAPIPKFPVRGRQSDPNPSTLGVSRRMSEEMNLNGMNPLVLGSVEVSNSERPRSHPASIQAHPQPAPAQHTILPDFTQFDLNVRQSPSKQPDRRVPRTPTPIKSRRPSQDSAIFADQTLIYFFPIQSISSSPATGSNSFPNPSSNPIPIPLSSSAAFSSPSHSRVGSGNLFSSPSFGLGLSTSPLSNSILSSVNASSQPLPIVRSTDFDYDVVVGQGSFACAHKCRRRSDQSACVIKKYHEKFRSAGERKRILDRVKNLLRVQQEFMKSPQRQANPALEWHPNLLQHYAVWQEDGRLWMWTEFCKAGDLTQKIHINQSKVNESRFSATALLSTHSPQRSNPVQLIYGESEVWRFILDIGSGLAFLHECGIIHKDIKPANCLLDENGTYKLGDLDSCVRAEENSDDDEYSDGSYLAPEVLNYKPGTKPTSASDIYSLGITIYTMVTGSVPANDNDGIPHFDFSPSAVFFTPSEPLQQLILAMTARDPEKRPSMNEILAVIRAQNSTARPAPLFSHERTISSIASASPSVFRQHSRSSSPPPVSAHHSSPNHSMFH